MSWQQEAGGTQTGLGTATGMGKPVGTTKTRGVGTAFLYMVPHGVLQEAAGVGGWEGGVLLACVDAMSDDRIAEGVGLPQEKKEPPPQPLLEQLWANLLG